MTSVCGYYLNGLPLGPRHLYASCDATNLSNASQSVEIIDICQNTWRHVRQSTKRGINLSLENAIPSNRSKPHCLTIPASYVGTKLKLLPSKRKPVRILGLRLISWHHG